MSTIAQLLTLIDDLIDTNTTDFPVAKKVRFMNKNQDKIVNLILEKDSLHQYDDSNYTDLNEGFIDLADGVSDYDIKEDENFANLLFVYKVYLKDVNGTWIPLEKRAEFDINEGEPTKYRITGNKIILSPVPNRTASASIMVQFARIPVAISVSDTTKEVGIPTTFHHLLALLTSYDYARAKTLSNRNDILNEIINEEKRLGVHITKQNNDGEFIITAETIDSI